MPGRPKTRANLEARAQELGITVDELKQRRQERRERRRQRRENQDSADHIRRDQIKHPPNTNRSARAKKAQIIELTREEQTLADIYAEEYTTFDALRIAMIRNGIVEHRISPYEVIQRAIDDCATDYLLIRQRLEKDSNGNIETLTDHPLYEVMEKVREAMVRYSTFAMQYDIQLRQLKLSEARVAILANTLRNVLTGLGVNQDVIRQVPRLLIAQLEAEQAAGNNRASRLDGQKAEAIAEILHNDTEVVIETEAEDQSNVA